MTAISKDWASRAALPQHVVQLVNNLPSTVHPMSQFSSAITAMNSESKFAKAYSEGVSKAKHWEVRYFDRQTDRLTYIHTYIHTDIQNWKKKDVYFSEKDGYM